MPAHRYYDPEFFAMENELLWPRVWQMACRLDEIPKPGDFVAYDILDQSVIVTRVDNSTVKAYNNACRHRGVKLVEDGQLTERIRLPVSRLVLGSRRRQHVPVPTGPFRRGQPPPGRSGLAGGTSELWGGCAFINFDDHAPPLRPSIEPFASFMTPGRSRTSAPSGGCHACYPRTGSWPWKRSWRVTT